MFTEFRGQEETMKRVDLEDKGIMRCSCYTYHEDYVGRCLLQEFHDGMHDFKKKEEKP